MSAELHADNGPGRPLFEVGPHREERKRERPNVSGDLPTVLQAAPMFRRVVVGYDRFQVDTYVRWAEDELAAADREHEHLVARHLETRAELEEALELLSHSSGGGEFLQLSRRIGTMLAAAAFAYTTEPVSSWTVTPASTRSRMASSRPSIGVVPRSETSSTTLPSIPAPGTRPVPAVCGSPVRQAAIQ